MLVLVQGYRGSVGASTGLGLQGQCVGASTGLELQGQCWC